MLHILLYIHGTYGLSVRPHVTSAEAAIVESTDNQQQQTSTFKQTSTYFITLKIPFTSSTFLWNLNKMTRKEASCGQNNDTK